MHRERKKWHLRKLGGKLQSKTRSQKWIHELDVKKKEITETSQPVTDIEREEEEGIEGHSIVVNGAP